MFSLLKHFILPLIFHSAVLANETPAFDDLIASKFHSSTNNDTALAPLDGRSLLRSWLNPRVLTCEDPGYGLCPSKLSPCIISGENIQQTSRQSGLLSHQRKMLRNSILRQTRGKLLFRLHMRRQMELLHVSLLLSQRRQMLFRWQLLHCWKYMCQCEG